MCYSVEVEKELKRLAKIFKAEKAEADYAYWDSLRLKEKDGEWIKKQLNLKQKPRSPFFKEPDVEGRIFPGVFAPVIVMAEDKRVVRPMRYRVRLAGSKEEIPTKFNVFNARLDSLEVRQTWRPLFMHQHGLFPFKRFFEWVENEGKPRLISFTPKNKEIMWAPCLWDYWQSKDGEMGFYSFALITDDPPPEVLERGHDRCPIFLREDQIDEWLVPTKSSKLKIKGLLKKKEEVVYSPAWEKMEKKKEETVQLKLEF